MSHAGGPYKQDITISISARSQSWLVLICIDWSDSRLKEKSQLSGSPATPEGISCLPPPLSRDPFLCLLSFPRSNTKGPRWAVSGRQHRSLGAINMEESSGFLFFCHHGLKKTLQGSVSFLTVGTEQSWTRSVLQQTVLLT